MTDKITAGSIARRIFPFLGWFPMSRAGIRADVLAGLSVAMILVPQSMAYATLAGLPVVYGLYAAALPVVVGSMWGSSRFLHTGPVAMVSLLSAASLAPFAAQGTEKFIELSIMLALMVGVLRLALGVFRLGILMNFVSHPVMVGFTNAAALIIGLSLLNTFFNVPKPDTGTFLTDFIGVVAQLGEAHWPTILFGVGTLVILHVLRKVSPQLPGVLVVVVLGTVISALIGFEQTRTVPLDQIADPEVRAAYLAVKDTRQEVQAASEAVAEATRAAKAAPAGSAEAVALEGELDLKRHQEEALKRELSDLRLAAHRHVLVGGEGTDQFRAYQDGDSGTTWRLKGISGDEVVLFGGGQVVGSIPQGLPAFQLPLMDWTVLPDLLPAAFVMALIGFLEATSISRALAARRREKLNANQELIGQGLANIVGSFFQSYSVSGSFSRSAVAARSGANSGLFAVISAIGVVITMLLLTPYLYHLPSAVLAAIVMSAVFGLIDVRSLLQSWKVSISDGAAGTLTFLVTLYMAPDLAMGVIVGVVLATLLFVLNTVRPRSEVQGLRPDGTLAGADSHNLAPIGESFVVLRFDASLVFMNVAHFGDAVMETLARTPNARALLVLGNGINRIDSSGVEKVRSLIDDLRAAGCTLMFCGLKKPVREKMERAGLLDAIGPDNVFPSKAVALEALLTMERDGPPPPTQDETSLGTRLRAG